MKNFFKVKPGQKSNIQPPEPSEAPEPPAIGDKVIDTDWDIITFGGYESDIPDDSSLFGEPDDEVEVLDGEGEAVEDAAQLPKAQQQKLACTRSSLSSVQKLFESLKVCPIRYAQVYRVSQNHLRGG